MKYKVGDKVRVRKDLELDKKYGDVLYSLDMDKFKNKECVITKVGFIAYKINNSDHWWSEEMLEPVDELLEYALEKLGITKEELEYERDANKEDITFIEKCIKDKKELKKYCRKFNFACDGCVIKNFKDKYKGKCYGDFECIDVFRYLKEKGEI